MNKKYIKYSKIPAVIAIIALLLTFFDWHFYGYYTLMKFIVTGVAIYYAHYFHQVLKKVDLLFYILICIALLFNPVIPIHLGIKSMWMFVDVLVISFLFYLIFKSKAYENK